MTVSAQTQFLAAMAARALRLPSGKQLIADGQWHRCDVDGKADDGSYKLSLDGPVSWGLFQNWTDGEGVEYWRGDPNRELTKEEVAELKRRQAQARQEHEKEVAERQAAARRQALQIWHAANPAPPDHAYLLEKKIKPHGLRVRGGHLLVPMCAPGDAEPVNLQMIGGRKWFLDRRAGERVLLSYTR